MTRIRSFSARLSTLLSLSLVVLASVAVAVPSRAAEYLGPVDVVAAQDGKSLWVANYDAGQLAIVDPASNKVTKTIDLPAPPTGLVLSGDGATMYVTCAAPRSVVCAIDVASGNIKDQIPAGHTARGPVVSPDGSKLYVCNRFNNNVSVIDLATKKEIAKIACIREPFAAAITPDGKSVYVINHLPLDQADAYDVASEVTVIDTATNKTEDIRLPNGSSGLRDVCVSPDGKYVYLTHILARYQMPTTQLERGWMNTNALTILDAANRKYVNTVLLDDVDLGAANPWGVACSADSKTVVVSHAGTHEVSIIDAEALLKKLLDMPANKEEAAKRGTPSDDRGVYASATAEDVPNDLAFLVDLRRRQRLNPGWWYQPVDPNKLQLKGPRGLCIVGNKAYVAVYFSDLLAAVDLQPKPGFSVTNIALGPQPKMSGQRRGEMLFADAELCFQHWQSCTSCHPDARVDALNWDLMNDGLGNPKNARSMLLAHQTPPSMASGVRGNAEEGVRAGITHIQFAVRPEEDSVAIDEYLKSLQPVPSPYLVDGKLSAAAERGKQLFHSEKLNCVKCHPEPLYTDMKMHNVHSRGQFDRRDTFDTPTLVECWRTAPYMHDGQYTTMKEVFTQGKHGKLGGDVEGLTDEQLNDLVEFVLSL